MEDVLTEIDILNELKKLPIEERLSVVESILHLIREDLRQNKNPSIYSENELYIAAQKIQPYYEKDSELTTFTALDSEYFYE